MSWALNGGKFSDTLITGGERGGCPSLPQRPSPPRAPEVSPGPGDPEGDSDQWPLSLSRQGWGDRAFTRCLCLPEDKAEPGRREISATRCPKAPGRVLVHTSVSPSPDNLRRFALEREASEQVDIYLWKLVKGEHRRPPSQADLKSVPFPGLQGPLGALWARFVD